MLLYSAKLDGGFLSIADLPPIDLSIFAAIETLPGPTRDTYEITEISLSELYRYKQAMYFFMDTYVAYVDQAYVLGEVTNIILNRDSDSKLSRGWNIKISSNSVQYIHAMRQR